MKKQFLFLSFCLAFTGLSFIAGAQSRNDTGEFVLAAKDADTEIAMLLPAIQKAREAAAYVPILESARNLAARVQRAGAKMSKTQYDGFQRELAKIERDFSAQASQQAGTPHTCHGKCEADFPGTGGGKGWKRFICKLACIKIGPLSGGN
jgi:hypothetical protein